MKRKLGFIGGGNMAEALARGLLAKKVFKAAQLIASDIDPARRRKLSRTLGIATAADNLEVITQAPAIVIAVKPQTIDAVLEELGAVTRASANSTPAAATRLFIS
ncbi:MAG TPA: NAD(P)-binding domain-containing protein, partial [Pseudomonadota bacterium]|nr:NAD(P)-binding domain-containing protein [Pseudomonadota bacterium]